MTRTRSSLISQIYRHTTALQGTSVKDSAAITLMGTDVERIVQSLRLIHELWASILEVSIAVWLLARQLGAASVVPVIIGICESPIYMTVITPGFSYTDILPSICGGYYFHCCPFWASPKNVGRAGREKSCDHSKHAWRHESRQDARVVRRLETGHLAVEDS